MAGVRVGKVEKVELDGTHVRVTFEVDKGAEFGTQTGAAIKVKTLLGAMYLGSSRPGSGQLKKGSEIPLPDRVAVRRRARRSAAWPTPPSGSTPTSCEVAEHPRRPARTPPRSSGAPLSGLSDLSQNIAARDAQLNTLLKQHQEGHHGARRPHEHLVKLMQDGNKLFRALSARRVRARPAGRDQPAVARSSPALVRDTRADLKPALDHLENVVDVLNKNQDNLDNSLRLLAPFYRVFANTLGNGPWFDTYIQNLPPPELGG